MKKVLLSIFTVLMIISTSEAKIAVTSNNDAFGLKYQVDEAVTFIERGIRFHVYLNGEFDFDSHFYLRNRWNNQVSVFTDYRGRITRVGNVRIRYNSRGDVRRIGSVTMSYRGGWLQRVGNLTINYNRWGNAMFSGQVHWNGYYNNFYYGPSFGANFNWNIGRICVYNDPFFYGNQFRRNYRRVRQDANYIYYRRNSGASGSGDQIIRRRRAGTSNTNSNTNIQTGRDRRGNATNNSQTVRERRGNTTLQNNTYRRRITTNTNTNNRRRVVQNNSNNYRQRSQTRPSENRRERIIRNNSNTIQRRSQINKPEIRKKRVTPKQNYRRKNSRGRS